MKKFLSIMFIAAFCLVLGGCGAKVINKGDKLAIDGLNASFEITVTGDIEKVDMPELFTLDEDKINVKAGTNEGIGSIGDSKSYLCWTSILLKKIVA